MLQVYSPNQRTIRVSKKKLKEGDLYAKFDMFTLNNALSMLDPYEFKIYVFMLKNSNDYEIPSGKYIYEALDMAESTYKRAIHSMIDKGYITIDTDWYKNHSKKPPETAEEVFKAKHFVLYE